MCLPAAKAINKIQNETDVALVMLISKILFLFYKTSNILNSTFNSRFSLLRFKKIQ